MHRPVPVCFRRDGVNAMAENESVTPRQTPDGTRKNALRVRRIAIDTFRENVAYLHRDCEIYRVDLIFGPVHACIDVYAARWRREQPE